MIRPIVMTIGLVVAALATVTYAANPHRPHPHQGVLERFGGAPPRLELDETQLAKLHRGEAVLTQVESGSGGRGMVVQDIHARPELVWDRIGDFRAYPRMVDHVVECEPYLEQGDDIRVRFVLRVTGIEYEYYIRHAFRPADRYVTWTLDYSRESDLDDSVGYWYVAPHPSAPDWSRLFYSIDMRTRSWMPSLLRAFIAKKGLRDATRWVKREAEALQVEGGPSKAPRHRSK